MLLLLAINTLLLLAALEFLRRIRRDMATQADLEALSAKFDAMEEAVTVVADDIAALKQEIIELNENTNVDLTPLIARAEGIEARLRAAAGSNPGSDDEPPPGA